MAIWDLIDKYVGFKERKLIVCALIIFGGLSILSFTSGWFSFLDQTMANYPILRLRNLLGILSILIGIGIWNNRIG